MTRSVCIGRQLCTVTLVCFFQSLSLSQEPTILPDGTPMLGANTYSIQPPLVILFSSSSIYSADYLRNKNVKLLFRPPKNRQIVRAIRKLRNTTILVLLDDGSVYAARELGSPFQVLSEIEPVTSEGFDDIRGDALYVRSSSFMYVSRDSGVTWHIDSTGLGGETITGFALDSLQYVWGVTPNHLFRQHPDSSVWRKVTSFPAQPGFSLASAFVDRRNRIFVGAGSNGVYRSTDGGNTWALDTAGMGARQVARFCDDAFGNVYALADGPLCRSNGGTAPWVEIDAGLKAIAGPDISMNDITGDSALYAATNFGGFISTNQGNTWAENNQGINAVTITGVLKVGSGRLVIGAPLGIYYRNAGDTLWQRTYPQGRYLGGLGLFAGAGGSIYTVDNSQPFRSTDNGVNWSIDTTGVASLPSHGVASGAFYVDETGAQHTRDRKTVSNPFMMYKRSPAGSWTVDTSGMNVSATGFDGPNSFVSDGVGNFFCAYSNGPMYRRSVAGGSWSLDTAGLGGTTLTALWQGAGGDVYGGSFFANSFLYRRRGDAWTRIALPASITSSGLGAVSVDGSGAIFVAFFHRLPDYGNGVYFTTNSGASWTKAGLDSIRVTRLASFGDTTYALTQGWGVYTLTRTGASGVEGKPASPSEFALFQNYPNPFNPSTTIRYSLPRKSAVQLSVFNTLGQQVALLQNGEQEDGYHEVKFDGKNLSSGVYFYRIHVGSFVQTRKLLMIR